MRDILLLLCVYAGLQCLMKATTEAEQRHNAWHTTRWAELMV